MTTEQDKPHIMPSETESDEKQSGDPGRTPGKAEGGDDSDEANYEKTKEKKIAESTTRSSGDER